MTTWVAFLRAINLGGQRKFSPADVRAATEAAGCTDVATHINTGNVRLSTTLRSRARITQRLEAAYAADRGFEVPVVLLTPGEVREIAASLDEIGAGHDGMHYVSVLRDDPAPEVVARLEALGKRGERVVVRSRAVHLLVPEDYRGSSVSNTQVERVAGVATNRNRRVMAAIAEKWC